MLLLSTGYDRFARSWCQLVNALEDFRTLGIDFVSIHEGVDTSTANGRLVFSSSRYETVAAMRVMREEVQNARARWRAGISDFALNQWS